MSSSLEHTFAHSIESFVLMFLCLKYAYTHKKNKKGLRTVIPGQDQGSYLNDGTNVSESTVQRRRIDSWSQPGMTT